ncbi:MAG: LTA synthase family protein [Lachnospiraceae bacterium]
MTKWLEGVRRTLKNAWEHNKRLMLILFLTIVVLFAGTSIRTIYLCVSYPQEILTCSEFTGDGANLTGLSLEGTLLRSTQNTTNIYYTLEEPIPVREVSYEAYNVSRDNCRSYITLLGPARESSVILDNGINYIDFKDATPQDQVTALSMEPVTLRGVSYNLGYVTINPHLHFVTTGLRLFVFLAAAAVLLELVLWSLRRTAVANGEALRERGKKRPRIGFYIALGILHSIHAGVFVWTYLTQDLETYTMVYYLTLYASTSLFLLFVLRPDYREGGRIKREWPGIRILLLSIWSFAMTELLYSDQFHLDKPIAVVGNLVVYALLYTAAWSLIPGPKGRRYCYYLPLIFWLVVAGINHYYFEWRGQAFELSDLSMAETAKNVIGSYQLDVTRELFLVYVSFACLFLAVHLESADVYRKRTWTKELTAVGCCAAALLYLPSAIPYVSLWNTNTATKHNGYVLSYLAYAQKTLEDPVPDGYNKEETETQLASYEDDAASVNKTKTDPAVNVIVIMDEALADLPTTYGFSTDVDDMPYIHSLSGDNVRKGWMLSSVFGGTTADTEYEFLTGNSVAFLDSGSVPYTQYINTDMESMARLLKGQGFSTTAFHPYLASGYKRYKVYPLLGFDEFLNSDNYDYSYRTRMRSYVSDASDFQDVIELYENKQEGEPFFLFNVTMQNHGGYNSSVPAVDVTVHPTDETLDSYAQLQEYLSLAHATDEAFQELTDYFSKVDEKTIILMFGDHQPGMDDEVYKALCPEMYEENASVETLEKKYTVPYVMWANYDLDSEEVETTSPGFLGEYLLQNAGVQLSAYDLFLEDVQNEVNAINLLGYQTTDGTWHSIENLDEVDILQDYKKAAYYALFGKSGTDLSLFAAADPGS